MGEHQLPVETRQTTGKGHARKLRAAGRVPAVCYSASQQTTALQLDPSALDRLLRKSAAGMNTLIDLAGGGLDGKVVLVKELQRDPVRGELLHVDLYAVDVDKAIEVAIPVHVSGIPVGVTLEGGILDFPLREIEVLCLPGSIPEELRVEVAELQLGDSIHVRDIVLPEGVELISDPDLSVVSVVAPAKVEEETPAVGEEVEGVEGAEGVAAAEGAEGGAAEDKKSEDDD